MLLATALLLAAGVAHAETHSGGVGPDGRPIAPGASQAKLFQLVNACLAGRGGAGIGAGIGGGAVVNPPPSSGQPDFSGGGFFAPPAVLPPVTDPGASLAGSPASGAGDVARGNATFNAKCLSCHMAGGIAAGKNASGPKGASRVQSTTNPMPPSGGLSAQEKADLVAFLNNKNGVR